MQEWCDRDRGFGAGRVLAVGTPGASFPSGGWARQQFDRVLYQPTTALWIWPDTAESGALDQGGLAWCRSVHEQVGSRVDVIVGGGLPGLDARDALRAGRMHEALPGVVS